MKKSSKKPFAKTRIVNNRLAYTAYLFRVTLYFLLISY